MEFPPGPLSIGDDLAIIPIELSLGNRAALGLSATDSCRDRFAPFYRWNDRQALALAVEIGRARPVDLGLIREWSAREEKTAEFGDFLRKTGNHPERIKRSTSAGTHPTGPLRRR